MKPASLHTILNENIKIVFLDFFDTLIHRTVHPNYTQRLWAKILIREFGLKGSIDSLYFTRRESSIYLKNKFDKLEIEIPYDAIKNEVFNRLENNLIIESHQRDKFLEYFELADLKSEITVQYLNPEILVSLKKLKAQGLKIYVVSDFYGSVSLFNKMIAHHGLTDVFEGIFSSSSLGKSKQQGTIYGKILKTLSLDASQVMMIGDNKHSDFIKAKNSGLNATLLSHSKYLLKNKIRSLGNDKKDYAQAIKKTYRRCQLRSSQPLSEYIIFYQVFVERLYNVARRFNIANLFFISREGEFLKKLFDIYQEHHFLINSDKIKTHYLRMSRQASFQISFQSLENESFEYLSKRFMTLSTEEFLDTFAFSDKIIQTIISELTHDVTEPISSFFKSEQFNQLKNNSSFIHYYNENRTNQKKSFLKYIESFNVDLRSEGIHVVDVGWGGTMQEAIYHFFNDEIDVTGYYLGLRETYNITEHTKRFGIIFSIHPYEVYADHILMANTQLYEQLLSANHGSALGYDDSLENFTIEKFKPHERDFFNNYIKAHQEFMLKQYKILLEELDFICYDYEIVQNQITELALRIGLFQNYRKLKFISELNKGFFQNVGDNKLGMNYNISTLGNMKTFIKEFIIQPESKFRYLVKLKSTLYNKNKLWAALLPMFLFYYYFRFNRYVRENILKRRFFLKYNYFR